MTRRRRHGRVSNLYRRKAQYAPSPAEIRDPRHDERVETLVGSSLSIVPDPEQDEPTDETQVAEVGIGREAWVSSYLEPEP